MAINRKGMRKIVVDDETFYYKVRRPYDSDFIELFMERPDGELVSALFSAFKDGEYTSITPKQVEAIARLSKWEEIDGGFMT